MQDKRTWLDTMLVLLGRRAPSGEGPISGRLPPSCHITVNAVESLGLISMLVFDHSFGLANPWLLGCCPTVCRWSCSVQCTVK